MPATEETDVVYLKPGVELDRVRELADAQVAKLKAHFKSLGLKSLEGAVLFEDGRVASLDEDLAGK